MHQVITKKQFAALLGISESTLRRWLNELYYDELKATGYRKSDRILKPQVLQWLRAHLAVVE